MTEEAHLDGLPDLHPLSFLDKDLPSVLAAIAAIKARHPVLLRMVSFLERLQRGHQVVPTSHTVRDDPFGNTGSHGTLDDGSDGVHRTDNLGLILRRHVQFDLLEQIFRGTESSHDQHILGTVSVLASKEEGGQVKETKENRTSAVYLKQSVLGLNGNDLVANELENAVHHGLETLENLLIGKGHVPFLDARIGEIGFDTHVDRPLLTVVPEVCLDTILEIHNAFGIDLARRAGSVRELHFADLGAQDVAEVAVQRGRTTRIARSRRAFGHAERLFFLHLVGDEIDGATSAIHDQNGVAHFEIEQSGLGAK